MSRYNDTKQGKLKLLIFFGTECGHCRATLPDISSSEWIKTGETDICAIEIWDEHMEDDVRAFQTIYCPEGISDSRPETKKELM